MSKADRPILEAALESSEVAVDLLTDDAVVGSIPVIGSAFKLCKAADAIRDKLLVAKLTSFFNAFDKVSEATKDQIKEKISASSEEAQAVGASLLLAIDRVTDISKPQIFSYLFLAYIDGIINAQEFRRIVQAVDAAFTDDLDWLLRAQSLPGKSADMWLEYLVPSGFTRIVTGETFDDFNKRYFEPTALANKLRNAYFHGRKVANS